MSRAWQGFERRCADLFGGLRSAFSGARPDLTGTRADVRHQYLFIEAKQRKRHGAVRVWDEAASKASVENKIPVVALAEKNRRGCWILIYSGDLDRLSKAGQYEDLPIFSKGGKGA